MYYRYYRNRILVVLFFVLNISLFNEGFAQKEEQIQVSMAREFFFGGQDQKSIQIYEELIERRFVQEYYDNLITLYYRVDEPKKAEKLIKKTIKQFPNNSIFIADLGIHYMRFAEKEKGEKELDKAIANLDANQNNIVLLANYFIRIGNLDYGIKTYQRGRELLKDQNRFVYEISYLYQRQGRYEEMTTEYISLVEQNPIMLNQVKIYLGSLIQQDQEDKFLEHFRKAILKKTQQETKNESIAQLYVWILLQQKNYALALNQAKSIDNRFENLTGQTVYEISNIALNNQDYKVAKEGFMYLINKGEQGTYYLLSRIGLLNALYNPFISTINHTEKEINFLKTQYETTLIELGRRPQTIPIMQQYAYLLAYYLNSSQEAVDILEQTIAMPQIKRNEKAQSKLLRADIYLMENDIWEASLTYSQVEKEYKNDVIGSDAKFKNAMLSYYNSDFEWAQSQFDALRSSTTKLIANDAMQYSLLISDNIDPDSSYNGLTYYSKAEFSLYQHKYDQALAYLDTLNHSFLTHPLFDEALYKRAEISIQKHEYIKADSLLNQILLKYPTDLMADDALYLLAELSQTHFHSSEKAIEYYQRIILDYPSSLYVTEARKRYNELKASNSDMPKYNPKSTTSNSEPL
jgi:tetratricopeptide (TPR) repeat protein